MEKEKTYDILSLFGKEELEDIQRKLSKVTQLGFITVNYKGEPITDFTHFCALCGYFRHDKEFYQNCQTSDALSSIQASLLQKPNIYKCPCGLMEIAIPIIVDGVYLGGFLCGQALCTNEPEHLNTMQPVLKNDRFYQTLERVAPLKNDLPKYTYEKFEDIASLVSMVIEMLCVSKINQLNERKQLYEEVETLKNLQNYHNQLLQKMEQYHYLSFIQSVKDYAKIFYQAHSPYDQHEFLNVIQTEFSSLCLETYPMDIFLFQSYDVFELWFIACYDYEYNQKIIQKYPILDTVFTYIQHSIKQDLSLNDIVEKCDISQAYLSKLFRQCFNLTVMDYIHLRKINIAKYWMLTTTKNIGDISFELGYNEPTYFSKIFKKYEGINARDYKNENRYLNK